MKQEAKIIKRTYGDGTNNYLVRIHTIHDNAEQSIRYLGGPFTEMELFDSLESAQLAALKETFTDTIEE